MLILLAVRLGFSTLKILATVKPIMRKTDVTPRFSTLKILATVKQNERKRLKSIVLVPLRF